MTPVRHEPFMAWPGVTQMRYALSRILIVALWFAFIYVGSDWLRNHRATHARVHMDWELKIPLIPVFTLLYVSSYTVLFNAAPFVLRTKWAIDRLARQQAIIIALAAVGFFLLPADLAYPPPTSLGIWGPIFLFADRLNLDHNHVPSLHVALTTVFVEHYATRASPVGKWLLRIWGVLIAASTLLTHQHHVLDVVTAYALAFAVLRFDARRIKNADQSVTASTWGTRVNDKRGTPSKETS